jgi:hypothetical protein
MSIAEHWPPIGSERASQLVDRGDAPTLVPGQDGSAAPAAAKLLKEPSPPASWFARLLVLLDQPFRFLANLTSFGFVGIILASLIQYSSWRDDKHLARHHEELDSAISNFQEISKTLSGAMNLQQILYFTFKSASGGQGSVDRQQLNYLTNSGKTILAEYTAERTALRKSVDILIGKADLFIDRPTRSYDERLTAPDQVKSNENKVFSNRAVLKTAEFDCAKNMPQPIPITVGKISIDWRQTRDHVATFYFCLEDLHYMIYPARVWAIQATVRDLQRLGGSVNEFEPDAAEHQPPRLPLEQEDKIEDGFDLQATRLNDFITLSTNKIEEMRLRTRDNGFFRHQLCFFCSE